jgi:hypothetical protein
MEWAHKMLGVSQKQNSSPELREVQARKLKILLHDEVARSPKLKLKLRLSSKCTSKKDFFVQPRVPECERSLLPDDSDVKMGLGEDRRKKESAKPLSAAEVKAILADDDEAMIAPSNWVRRSTRQPSRSTLNAPKVRSLLEKLKSNDTDMIVLKMKKYLSDPDTPSSVIDVALDALEENSNCEALYIQVNGFFSLPLRHCFL